jgi:hypothetical protein
VLQEELVAHLKSFQTAPFLFVGSGMSRRYLGLEDWQGLLRRFADLTPYPYARLRAEANGDNAATASRIAAAFHDVWWDNPEYEASRSEHEEDIKRSDSALKIEVSRYMDQALHDLDEEGEYEEELARLRDVVVDGIISTNYDGLLEHLFPDLRAFVGQDDVLFSETQAVGEIYKIHGSSSQPNSLVLTAEDYADFNERNAYLAAKLLTIFADHPVVFLGYSMQSTSRSCATG